MSDGIKLDTGKARWSLVPWVCMEEVVRVLMHGANKYPEADNWKRVANAKERYFDAAIRHLTAWQRGERVDAESGCLHLAHAVCCVLFAMWHDWQGMAPKQ